MYRPTPLLLLLACLLTIPAFAQNFMVRSYKTSVAGPVNRGDFNNDNIPDVVFCSSGVGVALSTPSGFLQPAKYSGNQPCQTLAVGDFNHDGKLDVVISALGSSTTQIMLGNGDGTFHAGQTLNQGASDLVVADFNRDGDLDVAMTSASTQNTVYIFPGVGNGSFASPVTVKTSLANMYRIRVGDFDADGKTDLVVSGQALTNSRVIVLFNNGSYNFTQKAVDGANAYLLNTADINQDGFTDLLLGQNSNCVSTPKEEDCDYSIKTLVSNRAARTFTTTFTTTVATNSNTGANDATMADVDADGLNDIVAVTKSGVWMMGVWKGRPNGSFDPTAIRYELGGSTTSIGIAELDANRDGRPDFAVINAGDFGVGLAMMLNAWPDAGCSKYTVSAGVTGCHPVNFTYLRPNVHFLANGFAPSGVNSMQLYVDNKLAATVSGAHLDLSRTLVTGPHVVTFKENTNSGASFLSPRHVNIFAGTPGPTCSTPMNTAKICSPSGSTSPGSVYILAAGYTPNAPTAMQLYIDNQLKTSAGNLHNYINSVFTLPTGSHHIVFKVYDAQGHVVQASKTITVQ